jgi:RNA polymerase sigma-70 factor (ECF subfamily)
MGQQPEDITGDQALMLAVREGDVSKLGILFERHHARLFNYLFRLTGNRHLSEDLVQEVFVRLLKYRHTYRGECQFATWMYQIARNARTDFFRGSSASALSLEDQEQEFASSLPLPDENLAQDEEMRIVLDALNRLPEKKREVLLLRGLHGMKFEEIAKVMDCPVNTAKGRAFDAIRTLRSAVLELRGERVS